MGEVGLTSAKAEELRQRYGDNRLPEGKKISLWKRFWENLNDPIIRVLLIALAVNIGFTIPKVNWAECIGIVLSILISATVSSLSEQGSEKAFRRLRELGANEMVTLIRDGKEGSYPLDSIVAGDLVVLYPGDRVPCDGFLVTGELLVDESALNGESTEVRKAPSGKKELCPGKNDALLRGSLVCSGEGKFLAEKVGAATLYGRICTEIQADTRQSPLKLRLGRLAKIISRIGYGAAVIVALTYLLNVFVIDSGYRLPVILAKLGDWHFTVSSLIHAVTIAMTVIVVAVPEGLPMMITVVLSANMKKMLRDGVLVRKLVGIETAGSMNLLFTDKTGTVTTGKLRMEWLLDHSGAVCKPGEAQKRCMLVGSSCRRENGKTIGGNATERALVEAALRRGEALPPVYRELPRLPFDSVKKFSAGYAEGYSYYRGASELLLERCDRYLDGSGREVPFTDHRELQQAMDRLAGQQYRLLVLARSAGMFEDVGLPSSLCFLGLAVLRDPIRPSAAAAIRELQTAGIQVVMITGDSRETAAAIAAEVGLLTPDRSLILTSVEMATLSDYELKAALPHLALLSRALPQDKSRLVRVAQECDQVVGMTGDGVNDAPALKIADVGFSMGNGSEIAKEAGDIELLREDLKAISNAVLYGRTIFQSIRKFILFQLTMNLAAVGVSLFGQLMGIDQPVTVVQMLWVNLIMDTLGGLAFAGEPPLQCYLRTKPKRREEPILTGGMLGRVLWIGGFTTLLCVGFLGSSVLRNDYGYYHDPIYFLTAYFALFIFSGIAICFTSRSESLRLLSHIRRNKPFLFIMSGIVGVQMLMLYFGGAVFRCTPLSFRELLLPILLSASVFFADLIGKGTAAAARRSKKRQRKSGKHLAKPLPIGYNQ